MSLSSGADVSGVIVGVVEGVPLQPGAVWRQQENCLNCLQELLSLLSVESTLQLSQL